MTQDGAPDIDLVFEIKRPPHEVRAWWTEFPDEYRASDPKEQPHRIVTLEKGEGYRRMETFWRGPLGRELRVPETFRFREHGDWNVEVALPLGLKQLDEFTLEPTHDGTRVHIRVTVQRRSFLGRITRGMFVAFYARKNYPRTWRSAARLCERDAPHIPLVAE